MSTEIEIVVYSGYAEAFFGGALTLTSALLHVCCNFNAHGGVEGLNQPSGTRLADHDGVQSRVQRRRQSALGQPWSLLSRHCAHSTGDGYKRAKPPPPSRQRHPRTRSVRQCRSLTVAFDRRGPTRFPTSSSTRLREIAVAREITFGQGRNFVPQNRFCSIIRTDGENVYFGHSAPSLSPRCQAKLGLWANRSSRLLRRKELGVC
jgi:hypothetical protein